jgi:hypothetical protein
MVKDANGNLMIEEGGERKYVNQPGLDVTDVLRFGSKVAGFIPAGRGAAAMGSLGGRVAAGGALSGITDVAMQAASGRSKIDPAQAGIAAAGGAAGEALFPLLRAIGSGVKNAVAPANRVMLVEQGKSLAQRLGLGQVSDDAAAALARRSGEIDAGARPEAILAENQLGYRLTRGQMTGDESLLRKEELLRQTDPTGPLAQLEKRNLAQTGQNIEALRKVAAKGAVPESAEQDAALRIQQSLRSAQKQGREAMRTAYSAVPDQTAFAGGDDVAALSSRPDAALKGAGFILTPQTTPNAMSARQLIAEAAADSPGQMRMDRMIALRKSLSRISSNASAREDQAALGIIMRDFDKWFDDSITRSLMNGGEDAVSAFRNAQGVARDFFKKFEDGKSESGRAIIKMMQAETPESVANVLLGASGVNKPGASAIARRYLDAVGRNSDGASALRDVIARRIFQNAAGVDKGHQALVSQIKDALNGRGRSLLSTVFSKTELAAMNRFAQTLDTFFVPKGMLGRSSGTAERLAAWLSPYANLPIARAIKPIVDAQRQRSAMQPLLLRRPDVAPALGAAAATQYEPN